jgi:TolB-like protein
MSLFAELKRRKVIRVAVVYAATAFAVLQAADIMLPQMGVPEWGLSLVVALIVLGFPIAIVLGWALEVTPEGVRVTPSAALDDSADGAATPALLGKRTLAVAGGLLLLGIGLGAGWFLKPPAPPAEPAAAAERAAPVAQMQVAAEIAPVPEIEATALARGVAVLPFENLSEDPANAFFAGGVHEEVLTSLSLIADLRVISRTSMLRIAESQLDVPAMAQRLGVSHVLEGSVRRAGNRVRVTVQLIDAARDEHLWAETTTASSMTSSPSRATSPAPSPSSCASS